MSKSRSSYFEPIGFVGAIRNQVNTKFAFRMFNGGIDLALGQGITFGKSLEVVNQTFHIGFQFFTTWWGNFMIFGHDDARIFA